MSPWCTCCSKCRRESYTASHLVHIYNRCLSFTEKRYEYSAVHTLYRPSARLCTHFSVVIVEDTHAYAYHIIEMRKTVRYGVDNSYHAWWITWGYLPMVPLVLPWEIIWLTINPVIVDCLFRIVVPIFKSLMRVFTRMFVLLVKFWFLPTGSGWCLHLVEMYSRWWPVRETHEFKRIHKCSHISLTNFTSDVTFACLIWSSLTVFGTVSLTQDVVWTLVAFWCVGGHTL